MEILFSVIEIKESFIIGNVHSIGILLILLIS